MILPFLALTGRTILLGTERVFVKKLKNYEPTVVLFWQYSLPALMCLAIILYTEEVIDFSLFPYIFIASLFYAVGGIAYIKALHAEDISLIAPIYNFNALFLLLFAVIFLGESFTLIKLAGILLLIFGASFLTSGKGFINSYKALFTNKGVLYGLVWALCYAVGRIFDGFVVRSINPVVYALITWVLLVIYVLIYNFLTHKLGGIKEIITKSTGWTLALGFQNGFSYLFLLFAFTQIQVSIADPLTMLSIFITIIFGKVFFKEKVAGRLIGAIFMVAGAVLLVGKF